jgi:iron(III) transport system substrate-binding protein
MKGKLFTIAALVVGLTFVFASTGLQAKESITAYMGFVADVNELLAKKIEENTGIEVKHMTLSWGEIWAKVMTEAPRFNADMLLSVGVAQAIQGTQKGFYLPYKSPAWNDIDQVFKSPDGYWHALGTFSFILLGNKVKLAEKGYSMPTTWKALLDPKWKGQISLPSIRTSGTAFLLTYSFLQLYGEKEGWKFLEALNENVAFYAKSGGGPTEFVGRGEHMLGLASDESILDGINVGYPLLWKVPEEGIGYEGNYITILKGTKKLDLAKRVIDYLGTKEVSEFMASRGYFPPRPGIPSALYGATKPKYIKLDHAWAVKNRSKIIKIWKSKFIMKETSKAKRVGDEKEKKAAEMKKQ